MHRTSITEALLGTAVLFNTVFEMPEEPMIWQIFSWLVVFGILIACIETARDWEERIRRRKGIRLVCADDESYFKRKGRKRS